MRLVRAGDAGVRARESSGGQDPGLGLRYVVPKHYDHVKGPASARWDMRELVQLRYVGSSPQAVRYWPCRADYSRLFFDLSSKISERKVLRATDKATKMKGMAARKVMSKAVDSIVSEQQRKSNMYLGARSQAGVGAAKAKGSTTRTGF